MGLSLHDMVEDVVKRAEKQAYDELSDLDDLSKTASASDVEGETPDSFDGVDYEHAEKVASAIEWIVEELGKDPEIEVRRRFTMAKEATHGVGSSATQLQDSKAKDGKQAQPIAQGKKTPEGSKDAVEDNEGELKKRLAQTQPQISMQKKAEREALKQRILSKLGGMETSKPNIANKELSGPDGVSAAGEGPTASGPGAAMVSSVDKVINLTKGQAKSLVKKDLAKVWDNKALSKSTDKVLHENLRNASKAGVKIAGASSEVRKRFAAKQEGEN
jgi:hypothetical protein